MSQLTRFPCPGALLMQTAIFSSHLTWEKYIEPGYRDRTIRIRKRADGLEVLELVGGPTKYVPWSSSAVWSHGQGRGSVNASS